MIKAALREKLYFDTLINPKALLYKTQALPVSARKDRWPNFGVAQSVAEFNPLDRRVALLASYQKAGEEALAFAVKELSLSPALRNAVFLQGVLGAAMDNSLNSIKAEVSEVVQVFQNKEEAQVQKQQAGFSLNKGFEVEWWPKNYTSLPKGRESLALKETLEAFHLLTAEDGYGEFASYPSRSAEMQVYLLELLNCLGLFSSQLSVSLHVNLGLPFDLPWYVLPQIDIDAFGNSVFVGNREHTGLYEALALIWMPLGFSQMTDGRWRNMWRKEDDLGDVRSIRVPFYFHRENVLGGDQSRLEYRVFEVKTEQQLTNLALLLGYLHHFSVALFWKELAYQRGNCQTIKVFTELGGIWAAYAKRMKELLTSYNLLPPNYISNRTAQAMVYNNFQETVIALRHKQPWIQEKLAGEMLATFSAIEAIIGPAYQPGLTLPPPIEPEQVSLLTADFY